MKFEWSKKALADLVEFASGGTPNKKKKEYWNGNIPWISAKTMKSEHISTSDLFITQEGLTNGSKLAPTDSLLLLVRGSGLFNGIPICYVDTPVAYNQDVKCITAKEGTNIKFIFYWLKSQEYKLMASLETSSIGAGKFDLNFLKKMQVSLPSSNEQKRIVSICDDISEKIALNNDINKNLAT